MHLPDYFLADMPAEATLSPAMVAECCQTLKRNRDRYLVNRSTHELVEVLCTAARGWLQPNDSLRRLALEQGPAATGFSAPTLAAGLDGFFRQLTPEAFQALLEQDLGEGRRLDRFGAPEPERRTQRAAVATAPELVAHITAGNLPNPALMSVVLGVLSRSAQFVKCARGGVLLPRLFAHSLYALEPKLGACLEIAHWPGGQAGLEEVLFAEADCVTATGSDETLADIRRRLPARTRFLGYGHRLSFGYVSGEVLSGLNALKVAARAAADVAAWDQMGCLSPHVIYVEQGGVVSPEQFAELLAKELAEREKLEPRGEVPVEVAAGIASRRSIYELRAAHSPDTRLWRSADSTAWTVVFEVDPRFQVSCLHRFIYVKQVSGLTSALESADAVRRQVSTVGLAVPEHALERHALELARWGATRVCPLGRMQNPPLSWRHDGRPALNDLIAWTDLEMP